MARLYADENFPFGVVERLRELGHDVLTAQDAGRANQRIPDPEVLAYSVSQDRAVLTHNRLHFLRLHKHTTNHSGIIICTEDRDTDGLALRIHHALLSEGSLENKLFRIVRPAKR